MSLCNFLGSKDCEKYSTLWRFILAIILSSGAYYYSTGFNNVWVLTWVASVPLFIYGLEASFIPTVFASLIAYFVGSLNQFGYLPIPVFLFSSIANAAAFTFIFMIFRYVTLRSKHWASSFIFASGWTAIEFITSLYSSYGTFNSIAYTQISNLPLIQIASVTGIWGITFLLTLIPVSFALVWHFRYDRSNSYKAGLIPACLLFLSLLFGFYRLYLPSEAPSIKVGIAAVPTTLEQLRSKDPSQVIGTINQYTKNVEMLARSGAEVVLLPEKVAILPAEEKTYILQSLADAARQNRITLIIGLTNREDQIYNAAYIFSPNGEISFSYHKQHLLPAFESNYTPGSSLGIIRKQDMGNWGIEICKDMDFVQPSRDYSRLGTGIMFVPALDFHMDRWLHARIAILRGVEGNYAVARAAQWGLLTLSDAKGRVVAMASTDASPHETLLIDNLVVGDGKSIYSKLGDWLGWVCVVIFCFSLIHLFLLTRPLLHKSNSKL